MPRSITLQIWKVESQSLSYQTLQNVQQSFLNTFPLKWISNINIKWWQLKLKILLKINCLQNFCCSCEILLMIYTKCIVCRNLMSCLFPFLNPQNQVSADFSTVIISAEIIVCRNSIICFLPISEEALWFQVKFCSFNWY